MRGAKRPLWIPDADWFWSHVEKNGPLCERLNSRCWPWDGYLSNGTAKGGGGYGMVRHPGAKQRRELATLSAHRVAWQLGIGTIPEGLLVLHACDNRACCNPAHLFLGDDKANSDDMMQKKRGRKARGSEQHLAKLTEEGVRVIRQERAQTPPTPLKELAERFGVSLVAVSLVARGVTWKHVL